MSMSVRGVRVGPVVLLLSVPLVCADSYECVCVNVCSTFWYGKNKDE